MPTDLPFSKLAGNHVVIGMDGGYSAVYAHLKPGSDRVKAGERVRAGELIGLLGNSGAFTSSTVKVRPRRMGTRM